MPDGALDDRLDRAIDTLLAHGDATTALTDDELAPLVRVAADLRHYPGPEFRARVRARLEGRIAMSRALVAPRLREGFTTLTPYLRARDAGLAGFVARVFGATETLQMAGSGGGTHREVRVGDSMIMIGEGGPENVLPIRPAELHVYVEDVDGTFARALAEGAVSLGAPERRAYGERAGFVRDPFGNHWFIATHEGGSPVPEGLRTVTPFVHAPAPAEIIGFLTQAFGAVEERRDEAGGIVRYARIRIGDSALELGQAEGGAQPTPSGFYLYVGDADVLYNQAVAAGAKSLWAPAGQPYGDRMAGVEDPMGNVWFIAQPA